MGIIGGWVASYRLLCFVKCIANINAKNFDVLALAILHLCLHVATCILLCFLR